MSRSEYPKVVPREQRQRVLNDVLAWSADRDYAGHSKHDALNSPFLNVLGCHLKWPRLLITQAVMRAPINIRPWFGVPRLRNPKGIGLFSLALLERSRLREQAGDDDGAGSDQQDAQVLLDWLIHRASPFAPAEDKLADPFPRPTGTNPLPRQRDGLKGLGWGYHYPWQDAGFFQPRHYPNRVVTSWIGLTFIRAYEVTGESRYLDTCLSIAEFLLENPKVLYEDSGQRCLSYVPLDEIRVAVMDVSALVAAFAARLSVQQNLEASEQNRLRSESRRLMAFVVDKQTEYGAWFYTWPQGDSHIRHDNYHTGIILDCLADYMASTGDREWESSYRAGLEHYRRDLFLQDGAPRWMNDRDVPHDIHGAANAILAFTRGARYWTEDAEHVDPEFSERCRHQAGLITAWTLENLYSGQGWFYYQKNRRWTKRFCLMRWANAWMCRALVQTLVDD